MVLKKLYYLPQTAPPIRGRLRYTRRQMLGGSRAAQNRCTRALSGGEIKDGGTQANTLGKQAFART